MPEARLSDEDLDRIARRSLESRVTIVDVFDLITEVRRSRAAGLCGDQPATILGDQLVCTLPHGHVGMHADERGARWTRVSPSDQGRWKPVEASSGLTEWEIEDDEGRAVLSAPYEPHAPGSSWHIGPEDYYKDSAVLTADDFDAAARIIRAHEAKEQQ